MFWVFLKIYALSISATSWLAIWFFVWKEKKCNYIILRLIKKYFCKSQFLVFRMADSQIMNGPSLIRIHSKSIIPKKISPKNESFMPSLSLCKKKKCLLLWFFRKIGKQINSNKWALYTAGLCNSMNVWLNWKPVRYLYSKFTFHFYNIQYLFSVI